MSPPHPRLTLSAGAAAGTLRSALEGSLLRLGVDHIELYYVHVDDRTAPAGGDTPDPRRLRPGGKSPLSGLVECTDLAAGADPRDLLAELG